MGSEGLKGNENKKQQTRGNELNTVESMKGNYIINDKVVISEGKIMNNPFSKRLDNSEASQWIINNEEKVKASIMKRLRMVGIYWGDVDGCYDSLIDEFNRRPELQFNKNHFGKGTGYEIEEYILNRVKYTVQKYRNTLKNHNTVPLLTQDESDYHFGEIEENFSESNEGDIGEEVVNQDNRYWDGKFEDISYFFEEFLQERSYKEFDFERFLYYMFLDVEEGQEDRLEKNYCRASKKIGESKELVETVVEDMIYAVKERDKNGEMILSLIKELIEGKNRGWIPIFIRKEK